jgi:hypothetical protein
MLRLIVVDIIGKMIYFPVWWYTKGTARIIRLISHQASDLIHTLNLKILAKFLFVPMYGLTDIWSRVISFPVRLVHFVVLSMVALSYMIALLVLLMLWLILPLFILYNILYQLGILPFNIYTV